MLKVQESGTQVKALENKPEPFPDLEIVWEMFMRLESSRQHNGFDYLPHSLDNILMIFWLYDITDKLLIDKYLHLIQALDFKSRQLKNEDKNLGTGNGDQLGKNTTANKR